MILLYCVGDIFKVKMLTNDTTILHVGDIFEVKRLSNDTTILQRHI